MFFLVFVLFLDCFFNMHLCAKLQPYRSNNFAHLLKNKKEVCRMSGGEINNTKIKNT